MDKNVHSSGPIEGSEARPAQLWLRRSRQVLYPLLVIGVIAAVIWYLEYRPDGGAVSPSSALRYGPVGLPAALVPPGAQVAPEEGALAPDFLLEELNGGELRLSDFRGRPVVLNFWATWCAPCRKEIPQLVQAHERYKDDGLVIIALNLQEGKAIIRPYAEDFGMDFPIAIDRNGEVGERYRLLGLPTTYFIDRDGVITSIFRGPLEGESNGRTVQGAIGESDLDQRLAEILAPPRERRPVNGNR
jgi:thiol-disulfide isomerase/thioredoxin